MTPYRRLYYYRWTAGLIALWSLFIYALINGTIDREREQFVDLARQEARATYIKDIAYRKWVSRVGGVYVPITDQTPPNPYLAHVPDRDVVTTTGRRLTLFNPAYVTRQVQELTLQEYGIRGHITSLNPIRPENAPDPWEADALRQFENGTQEVSSVVDMNGETYLRLMRPMVVEDSCLMCHTSQGYNAGDIRGGISASVPIKSYLALATAEIKKLSRDFGVMWLFGVLILLSVSEVMARAGKNLVLATQRQREQDAIIRTMFESTPDIFAWIDENNRYRMVNPAFCALTGKSREDIIGKEPESLFSPAEATLFGTGLREAVEAGTVVSDIVQMTSALGPRWFQIRRSPVFDADEMPTGLLNSIRDVTDLKSAEEALRSSEERMRAIMQALPDLMFRLSRDGVFLDYHSPENWQLYAQPDQFLGKNIRDLLPRSVAEGYLEVSGRPNVGNETQTFEYQLPSTTGEERTYEARIAKIGDDALTIVRDVTESRRAGEELRRSEERYRLLAERSTDVIWKMGMDLKFSYISPSVETLFGYPVSEALRHSFDEIMTAPSVSAFLADIQSRPFADSGRNSAGRLEIEMVRSDGTTFWAEVAYSVVRDDDGTPIEIIGSTRDITDRQRALNDLRASEERYRTILDAAMDGYRVTDMRGRVVDVSESYARMLGYEVSELTAMSVHDLEAQDSPADVAARIERMKISGEDRFESRHRHKDGRAVDVEVSIKFEKTFGGRFVAFVRDITDRKRAENELRDKEARFRLLAENVNDVIWMMDLGQRYIYQTPSVVNLLGYTSEEALALSLQDTLTPDSYELVLRTFQEEFDREGRPGVEQDRVRTVELEHKRKDGSTIWTEVIAKFLRDAGGRIIGVVGSTRDITSRRRAEILLRTRVELSEKLADGDVDALLQRTLDAAEELTGSNIGFFHFMDPDQKTLHLQAWSSNTIATMCKADGKGQHYPVGSAGVWADCFYTREPVIHNDYASLPNKKGMPDGHAVVVRELVVPMIQNDLIVAILGVGNKATDYNDEDVHTVQTLASLAMEVVARKRAEDALLKTSGELDQYFTRALDLFCIADTGGYFRRLNRQWAVALGYPVQALEGSRFLDLVHPDDLPATLEAVSKLAQQNEVIDFSNRYRCSDGSYRWIEWRAYPDGNTIFAAARDITERKEVEHALRESETLLNQAQEVAMLGHYVLNVSSGLWTSSATLNNVFGIDGEYKKTIEGWLNIIHPDDRASMASYLRDEVLGGQQRFDKLYRIVRQTDGVTRWVHGIGDLQLGPDGTPVMMFGVIQDVTKDIESAEQAEQMRQQLMQTTKLEAVGRLAGGIAHDFNNLLTVIRGHTELMLENLEEDSPYRGDLDQVIEASERASSLTTQLLAFSRKQTIAPRVIEVNELVAGSIKMLRRLIGEDIELEYAPSSSVGHIKADPHQVEQVLINLAVNARDAMPDGGRLRLETRLEMVDDEYCRTHVDAVPGTYVGISVIDTGVGIPPEVLPHIFEPFFTTKDVGKGTGLGLATVYGIVRQNLGFIEVSSVRDVGTAFHVYLPQSEEDDQSAQPEPTVYPGGSETILLVEDDDSVRRLARRMMERLGYRVLEFPDGTEALKWIRSADTRVDLLLTDVVMPAMNGRRLRDAIVALRPGLRALFMSGYTGDAVSGPTAPEGDFALLHKPFTLQQLAEAVRKALATA